MQRNIEELIRRPYARVLTPDENGGYVSEVLELPGCFSEGETPDEAMENLEDAMRGWFDVALEQGRPIPEPLDAADYSGRILLRTPKWVHRECVRRAEMDGVSLNHWLVEAISERLGAEGFLERMLERLSVVSSPVVFERQTVTSETSRLTFSGKMGVGSTKQLVEPDGNDYLTWTSIGVKEPQDA